MRRTTILILIIFLGGCSAVGSPLSSGDETSVLIVGNSHTFYNNMPEMVERIADQNGIDLEVDMAAQPGFYLDQHANSPETLDAINNGEYDVVVFQEQSVAPAVPQLYSQRTAPALTQLSNTARATGSQIVLYQTWARRDGLPEAGFGDYSTMQAAIIDGYNRLAASNGATVAPVGQAWQQAHSLGQSGFLYDPDGNHASAEGSYLAAIVIGETVTGTRFTEGPSLGDVDENEVTQLLSYN